MRLRRHTRISIQRRHPHDHMRLSQTFRHQMRTTHRIEIPKLAGRRLKTAQPILPLGPAKMLTHDPGGRGECCGVSLAASLAMAMNDRHVEAVELVFDGFAQAAAV
ncbi:hypothetical protein BK666_30425 [Pseudomonas frederiksbergensis]|uniref:Uncharacterized protein n=1 Tax=Pseudomonas frederiksbergensis TaxID=104087 RepID=A0A423JK98_9PSED|nr:hypothetical protein BK666_30425 [Pseudomonas frederiksbergensis]